MSYITAKNLSLGYDGKVIQKGVSFEIEKGDYLCIVGENGSGKSTLMKTLLGLQPLLGGEIIFGDDLSKNEIGYLPQQTLVQRDFPASVAEIVLSGCQGRMGMRPFYGKEEKRLAKANMERMQITNLAKRCYRELSGGQQQKVLLARALCATQKILLLDEPVSGLDPMITTSMYEQVKQLNEEGVTIIMISHDISAALKYASHILHINQKTFFGTKSEYMESALGKYFLEMEGGNEA
ncbi:metal ABC transporter ATP-binding protein [Eubacterium oxidoreducens]|uniref:Zinc transport system ATP-binding protein n=1 Tax=Eubacterium oxidoreducens TaxID=1732 RepID=A0A1G6AXH2_EUBOX|nr:ABC transporter ATP-binding protein [Eubacterium oxidoreducens]SDB13004.1 zinc transport system ATP-binding protein [Eubacterium oxidoreducens]